MRHDVREKVRQRVRRPERTAKTPAKKAWKIYMGIAIFTILLNVLAWSSTEFCDAYIAYVFPVFLNTYGRFTGWVPFSVGEWMLLAGVVSTALALVSGAAEIIGKCCGRAASGHRFVRKYLIFCAWLILAVCLVMTLNCSMLYHASTFAEKYLGGTAENYSLEDFVKLRNFVAGECNRLSAEVARDGQGYILYPGSVSAAGESVNMADKAREEMRRLGESYPQLGGYYSRPKPLVFSDFMCQQNMLGWYFPFSLEANYNDVAYVMNRPASMCHELAHLKGFIYEDEANFIGYLACVQSEDIYFQYSGYLSVLGYLERDLQKAASRNPEALRAACGEEGLVELLDVVYEDDIFVTEEEWERIEGGALLDTETVDKATNTFLNTTLKANGVTDGVVSYSRVVEIMLQYYYGSS